MSIIEIAMFVILAGVLLHNLTPGNHQMGAIVNGS